MISEFKDLINLIYIKGFFDKGMFNGKQYKQKPFFVLNLLKGSVDKPEMIDFTESAINSYITGCSIGTVAKSLNEAGFSCDNVIKHITSLYEFNNKDSIMYKEELYKKVVVIQDDVTFDNMAELIANCLDSIVTAAFPLDYTTDKAPDLLTIDEHKKIINSYTIKNDEKEAMTNLCVFIRKLLKELQKISRTINNLTAIIRRGNDDKEWIKGLGPRLAEEISNYTVNYKYLRHHYLELHKLLSNKGRLNESIKDIRKTAKAIYYNKYLISDDESDYSDMESKLSDLEKEIKRFLVWLDSI